MAGSLAEAMSVIRKHAPDFIPQVGIILGSGLSTLADQLTDPITIPYQAIPGLTSGSVMGHASLLVMGYLNGVPVVCLKGRIHMYEGASYESVRILVRIVKALGAHSIVITGAAGSLRDDVGPGELMMINDHINMHPGNPLVGPNDESIGPRFTGLEEAYDPNYRNTMFEVADRLQIPLAEGVYISLLGPCFETPAEIRAYRFLGADSVGMSVVPEVLVARHCGLKVLGIAAITNFASGMSDEKITHDGTLQFGEIVARKLIKLVPAFVKEIAIATVS